MRSASMPIDGCGAGGRYAGAGALSALPRLSEQRCKGRDEGAPFVDANAARDLDAGRAMAEEQMQFGRGRLIDVEPHQPRGQLRRLT